MSEEQERTPELTALEAALAALAPAGSSLDRDRLMYLAGRASVGVLPARRAQPRRWTWPLALAASMAISASLGLLIGSESQPVKIVERVVHVPAPSREQSAGAPLEAAPPAASDGQLVSTSPLDAPAAPAGKSYLALRNEVLSLGSQELSVLPLRGVRSAGTYRQLREAWLGERASKDAVRRPLSTLIQDSST